MSRRRLWTKVAGEAQHRFGLRRSAGSERGQAGAIQQRRKRALSRLSFFFTSSRSQSRITRQEALRIARFTLRSRVGWPLVFRRRHAARFAGHVACFGQPCQKQPSTNTTSQSSGKAKSSHPETTH